MSPILAESSWLLGRLWDWVWSSDAAAAIKEFALGLFAWLWQFIDWVADPSALLGLGLRLLSACLDMVEGMLPASAAAWIDTLQDFIGGVWFATLIRVMLWFVDYIMSAGLFVAVAAALAAYAVVCLLLRLVVIGFHQFWGSE